MRNEERCEAWVSGKRKAMSGERREFSRKRHLSQ